MPQAPVQKLWTDTWDIRSDAMATSPDGQKAANRRRDKRVNDEVGALFSELPRLRVLGEVPMR